MGISSRQDEIPSVPAACRMAPAAYEVACDTNVGGTCTRTCCASLGRPVLGRPGALPGPEPCSPPVQLGEWGCLTCSGPPPQKRLLREEDLAGEHSKFRSLLGLTAHYTVERPRRPSGSGAAAAAAHCYHGFGANSWSWSFVQVTSLRLTDTFKDLSPGLDLRVN